MTSDIHNIPIKAKYDSAKDTENYSENTKAKIEFNQFFMPDNFPLFENLGCMCIQDSYSSVPSLKQHSLAEFSGE